MQGTKKPRSPVRLVLVDDNPGVLETVGRLLEVDFEVQGKFASGAAALREIPRLEPDIAILDVAWAICRDLRWCGSCTAQGADRNSSSCRCWRGRKWCKARSLRARRDMCTSRESPPIWWKRSPPFPRKKPSARLLVGRGIRALQVGNCYGWRRVLRVVHNAGLAKNSTRLQHGDEAPDFATIA